MMKMELKLTDAAMTGSVVGWCVIWKTNIL